MTNETSSEIRKYLTVKLVFKEAFLLALLFRNTIVQYICKFYNEIFPPNIRNLIFNYFTVSYFLQTFIDIFMAFISSISILNRLEN